MTSFTMLTRSLIALAGFTVLSAAYKLGISDSELKTALEGQASSDNIFKCLIAKNNDDCDPVGKALKGIFPDVLSTDCANCNAVQDEIISNFFARISMQSPQKMKMTLDIYDPKREILKKFASSWRHRGIKF